MDGLSPARQPVAGFASALLANIGERPWAGFWLLSAAHAAIWTILPFALYPNLPLDIIEALTYGREWQVGYDKLPPLPWWLVETVHRAFDSDIAYYALGQLSVLAAFAAVWAFMLRIATPAAAAAAVLIIDGLHFFNFTAPKFNHDVIQLPFWALAGLSFHGALPRVLGQVFRGRSRIAAPAFHADRSAGPSLPRHPGAVSRRRHRPCDC